MIEIHVCSYLRQFVLYLMEKSLFLLVELKVYRVNFRSFSG